MRVAVISDIHGNLEALEAVLADIHAAGADEIFCLGDVVGYGADPRACLDRVREACRICLRGNHEAALLDPAWQDRMHRDAAQAIRWTATQLGEAELRELGAWPLVKVGADARLVHGSPFEPAEFHYLVNRLEIESAFPIFAERLCLCGHTHVPLVVEEVVPGAYRQHHAAELELEEERRYLINVGSVGQPRNGDPNASWVLITDQPPRVLFKTVPYPVERAQQKILQAGLAPALAQRLKFGR